MTTSNSIRVNAGADLRTNPGALIIENRTLLQEATKATERMALMQNLFLNFTRGLRLSATSFTKGPLSLLTSVDAIAGFSSFIVVMVNPL